EISPALVEIARENLATVRDQKRVATDVKIVRADAARYKFPRGDLVIFLYNPFRGPVLDDVLVTLRAPGEHREIVLLYHTPVERATIEATEAFELIDDLGFGLVYRLRR
ncbi:MAG TPA: hypothetical protein VFE35_03065, partial [Candidatus Cybelea sp.]|nr:hypothetical protein [Candidatus Cybelea sp.]